MDYFNGLSFSVVDVNEKRKGIIANNPQYYGIQYFHAGGIYLQIDKQKEYKLNAPGVFLTYPGRCFAYGPLEEMGKQYVVCFHGPRVRQYIQSGLFAVDAEDPLTKINHPEKFLFTFQELQMMLKATISGSNSSRAVLQLEDILLQIHEQREAMQKKLPAFQSQMLNDLVCSIRKNPAKAWDFEAIAREMHVSKKHFGRLFRMFCDYAPQEFVIHARLSLAAELLAHSKDSVRMIAAKVGIDNEFYFSRLFKKKYHLSPREYRRELIGENLQKR